jgi:hypothetical protein
VLRPGGTFRFVEHVAAHPISPRRWIQTALNRPWSWLFEGCQLCRNTGALIQSSGFAEVDMAKRRVRLSLFVPVNFVISGRARKASPPLVATERHTQAARPNCTETEGGIITTL